MNCIALIHIIHCIVLHCFALHCIAVYCVALYCSVSHCIASYCIVLNRIVCFKLILEQSLPYNWHYHIIYFNHWSAISNYYHYTLFYDININRTLRNEYSSGKYVSVRSRREWLRWQPIGEQRWSRHPWLNAYCNACVSAVFFKEMTSESSVRSASRCDNEYQTDRRKDGRTDREI